MNHQVTLSTLNDLIETSRYGERGFAMATQDNREPGVTDLLKDGEESCRAAAVELQDQVRLLGGAPEDSGAVKAPVYRGWIDFKAVAIARDTKLILEECERGEDYARRRYQDAMKIDLPESVRVIVERQYQRVVAIHGRVLQLRNRYPATEIPRGMGAKAESRP
ncbi:MAG: PA2169 family four-helix-bundle protein [Gammaproteobacteria bacterium]